MITEDMVKKMVGTVGLGEIEALRILLQDHSEEKTTLETMVIRCIREGIESYKQRLSKEGNDGK
jgi:hypothetical protein